MCTHTQTKSTLNFIAQINSDALARMKQGTMLINTSHGSLVDTRAVIEALKTEKLGAVGFDVYVRTQHTHIHTTLPHLNTYLSATRKNPPSSMRT